MCRWKMTFVFGLVPLMLFQSLFAAENQTQARLLEGMGDTHFPISVDSEQAQTFFDQGLVLTYGFNHPEAARSFRQAAEFDPQCAMCFWGVALVLGPNINAAMDEAAVPDAWQAVQTARRLSSSVTEKEKALIDALAQRYAPEPQADRSQLDRAYADAMRQVATHYPDDPHVVALFAEALMDLHPWNFWRSDGTPQPWTGEIVATLEKVLAQEPDHLHANHLYIHAVEASPRPERGLPSADRLSRLAPDAGHLVHMPAHIYIRTGRYQQSVAANKQAIEVDKHYLDHDHAEGVYTLGYVPHNKHFLFFSAAMIGLEDVAIDAARDMADDVDPAMLRQPGLTTLQHYWITPIYAYVRFGRWDQVDRLQQPDKDLVYPNAIYRFARALAFIADGDPAQAQREHEILKQLAADPALEAITIWDLNSTKDLARIAEAIVAGELAASRGEYELASAHFRRGMEVEDALNYDEPPSWQLPVRHYLGALLLQQEKYGEAETVFRRDLARHADNGWSLYGLALALENQNKQDEAQQVGARFDSIWEDSSLKLSSSRILKR